MKITVEMRTIYKNTDSPLKATANVIFDDCFVVHNVKVIETENGAFISMPSFRGRDENWHSICHPINSDCRKEITDAVIAAYQKVY